MGHMMPQAGDRTGPRRAGQAISHQWAGWMSQPSICGPSSGPAFPFANERRGGCFFWSLFMPPRMTRPVTVWLQRGARESHPGPAPEKGKLLCPLS